MGNRNGTRRYDEIVSMCEKMSTNQSDPHHLPTALSSDDLKLIQRVWTDVASDVDQDVAVDIFKSILSKSEAVRRLFGVTEKDLSNLDASGRYISHARLVKNALTIFVQELTSAHQQPQGASNVDSVARIVMNLRSLGARHVSMRKEGFEPDYWYAFAVSMIEVARTWPVPKWQRSRFERVWQELICYVIVNMRKGYEQELTKVQFLKTPTNSTTEQ